MDSLKFDWKHFAETGTIGSWYLPVVLFYG
jgi:hypothetical protein